MTDPAATPAPGPMPGPVSPVTLLLPLMHLGRLRPAGAVLELPLAEADRLKRQGAAREPLLSEWTALEPADPGPIVVPLPAHPKARRSGGSR